MAIKRNKTDYQVIAETFGVTVFAVTQAYKRREIYPNNRLLKAFEKLQEDKAKSTKVSKMKAGKSRLFVEMKSTPPQKKAK